MDIRPTPGYFVCRLIRPKDAPQSNKRLYIPGHGELSSSQAGFKPYGRVQSVNWDGCEPGEKTFDEGDLVAFQRGVLNPVALRDPHGKPGDAPDLVMGVDQVVAVIENVNVEFERGV